MSPVNGYENGQGRRNLPEGPELLTLHSDQLGRFTVGRGDWLLCAHGREIQTPEIPAGFQDVKYLSCDDVEDPKRGLTADQAQRLVEYIAQAHDKGARRIICVGYAPAPPGTAFARAIAAAFAHHRRSWWIDQAVMTAYRTTLSRRQPANLQVVKGNARPETADERRVRER